MNPSSEILLDLFPSFWCWKPIEIDTGSLNEGHWGSSSFWWSCSGSQKNHCHWTRCFCLSWASKKPKKNHYEKSRFRLMRLEKHFWFHLQMTPWDKLPKLMLFPLKHKNKRDSNASIPQWRSQRGRQLQAQWNQSRENDNFKMRSGWSYEKSRRRCFSLFWLHRPFRSLSRTLFSMLLCLNSSRSRSSFSIFIRVLLRDSITLTLTFPCGFTLLERVKEKIKLEGGRRRHLESIRERKTQVSEVFVFFEHFPDFPNHSGLDSTLGSEF